MAELTEHSAGQHDAVRVTLTDGRELVVRVPATDDAAEGLRAEVRALHALTQGMRELLPFTVPDAVGTVTLPDGEAVVTTFLEGYRVDPVYVPAGAGIAPALGEAIAAVHSLPIAHLREAGLVVRSAEQVRDEQERLIDRAQATRHIPPALLTRWRRALEHAQLWQFEPTATLAGADSSAFFLADLDGVPQVVGLAHWSGLSVGDPATDLSWLASAPGAASDVYDAYARSGPRAPDTLLRQRARLYAELEFARWLVHGFDTGDDAVVSDAEALLTSLADTVDDDLVPRTGTDVDAALAALQNVPDSSRVGAEADTSMHTDAYDPEELATWLASPTTQASDSFASDTPETAADLSEHLPAAAAESSDAPTAAFDENVTAPIDLPHPDTLAAARETDDPITTKFGDNPTDPLAAYRPDAWAPDTSAEPGAAASAPEGAEDEPTRAARAAFQRWTSSDSE